MIIQDNYGEEHIRELQRTSRKDPQLIERALYALGLLEALTQTGLKFIFKGGSSLMLLLEHPMRLSTDIDIVVEPGTDIIHYIEEAAKIFPFVTYDEQTRIGKNNIEKRHFKFTYSSPVRGEDFYILLDVLYEKNNYAETVEKDIANELLLTEGQNLKAVMPSIDCILGDKFTAFAPHTTGIPLGEKKDMEVMKQFYDICTLIDVYSDFDKVLSTYKSIAAAEIGYRGNEISIEDALKDSLASALVVASRGKVGAAEYPLYVEGTRAVGNHIYAENYSAEIASYRASHIIYMAACLLTETPYERITDYTGLIDEKLTNDDLRILQKMRKVRPMEYAYLIKADLLLAEYRR